jgi:hypothetical protein
MLKNLKNPIFKIYKTSLQISNLQKFRFGGGHHGSDSEHDHSHSEHSDHDHHHDDGHCHGKDHNTSEWIKYDNEERNRIFSRRNDDFNVEEMLARAKAPLKTSQKGMKPVDLFETEKEYINFLATTFERKTLEKYPEYKKHLEKFLHKIPDYEEMNAYQREVYTLDAYLHWKLETTEDEIRDAYDFKGTSLEQARQRFAFFEDMTKVDHHKDNKIMHHLKEKLHHVLENEVKFEEFKNSYNEKIQDLLLNKIMEKRKSTDYYNIVENKTQINQSLTDLNVPENHLRIIPHAMPHDHIHQQHYLKDPKKTRDEKYKYLAYFDIIVDHHIRQVRPENQKDDIFKYVKEEYRQKRIYVDDLCDNMYYDYKYTMDNEFYLKFVEELDKNAPGTSRENQDAVSLVIFCIFILINLFIF